MYIDLYDPFVENQAGRILAFCIWIPNLLYIVKAVLRRIYIYIYIMRNKQGPLYIKNDQAQTNIV